MQHKVVGQGLWELSQLEPNAAEKCSGTLCRKVHPEITRTAYLGGEAALEVGDEVVGQSLGVVAVCLHKALEGDRPAIHAHAVKERVPALALQLQFWPTLNPRILLAATPGRIKQYLQSKTFQPMAGLSCSADCMVRSFILQITSMPALQAAGMPLRSVPLLAFTRAKDAAMRSRKDFTAHLQDLVHVLAKVDKQALGGRDDDSPSLVVIERDWRPPDPARAPVR